jgi:ABC-2 type transport system permease protein
MTVDMNPKDQNASTRETDFGSRQAVTLVARREVITRFRGRAFKISTLVMVVGILVTVLVSKAVGGSESSKDVGFVQGQQISTSAFRAAAHAVGQKVTTPTITDRATGEQQLRDGKLDALVIGTTSTGSVQIEVKKTLDSSLRNAFTVLTRQEALNHQLQKAGVDPATVSEAVAAAKVDVHPLQHKDPNEGQKLAIGIIAGIAIYVALLVYGQAVAQGVVEEKTSRIVELLLTAIRPWQLMLGKVLGIGLLGLGQLVLVAVVGIGAGAASGVLTLPSAVVLGAIITILVWFLLGYVMYALLFAALGALVSRQEDVGGAVAPITMLIIIPYIIGISTLPANPDSTLIAGLSLIPLFSPTLIPMRIAGGIPGWQMAVAVVLAVLLIGALVWLAGRIYGNAVTRTGARVRLSDALRPI